MDDAAGAERLTTTWFASIDRSTANNTYTARYLTERQPNRDLLTGDTATVTPPTTNWTRTRRRAWRITASSGSKALNTLRVSIESEHIQRGAEPGDFLETNRKDLEAPVLRFLSFDEQGHVNGQHRNAMGPGLDDTFSLFVPGKRGDHDLKFGFQYLYAINDLSEQGSMNGVFSFPSDKPFNAADPSTYPERLSIRVPIPGGVTSFTHSFGHYAQDKWRITPKLTLNIGLRYDVDVFPFVQPLNPLLESGKYPVDKNNFQPRFGFAYNVDGRSVVRGGIGRFYEKLFVGQASPLQETGVFGRSLIVNFPVSQPIPARATGACRPIRCWSTAPW